MGQDLGSIWADVRLRTDQIQADIASAQAQIHTAENAIAASTTQAVSSVTTSMSSILTSAALQMATTLGIVFSAKAIMNFASSAVSAFANLELATNELKNVLKNIGISDAGIKSVNNFIASLSNLSHFTKTEITNAITNAVIKLGDEDLALKAVSASVEVARARNMSLDDATQRVTLGLEGNARGLRDIGINIKDYATGTLNAADKNAILDAITIKLTGSMEAYNKSLAGVEAKERTTWENMKIAIGGALAPFVVAGKEVIGVLADMVIAYQNLVDYSKHYLDRVYAETNSIHDYEMQLEAANSALAEQIKLKLESTGATDKGANAEAEAGAAQMAAAAAGYAADEKLALRLGDVARAELDVNLAAINAKNAQVEAGKAGTQAATDSANAAENSALDASDAWNAYNKKVTDGYKTTADAAKTTADKAKAAADAIANANTDLGVKIYNLTHTELEQQLHAIDLEAQADITAGDNEVAVATWVKDSKAKIYAEDAATKLAIVQAEEQRIMDLETTYMQQGAAETNRIEQDKATLQAKVEQDLVNYLQSIHERERDAAIKAIEDERDAKLKAIQDQMDAAQTQYDDTITKIDAERDAQLGPINYQITALEAQHSQQQRQSTEADLRDAVANATTAEERAKAMAALQKQQDEWAYEDKLAELHREADAVNASAVSQENVAKDTLTKQQATLKTEYDAQTKYYQDEIDAANKFYADLLTARNLDAEAQKDLATKTNQEIMDMLQKTETQWSALGSEIGDAFWSNLMAGIVDIQAVLEAMAIHITIPHVSVGAFAGGGEVYGPTLALLGENATPSNPEIITPPGGAVSDSNAFLLQEILEQMKVLNARTMPNVRDGIADSVSDLGRRV
jgi:hypothetical protein